jgi:hypothetical protein
MNRDIQKLEMLYDATCRERTDILLFEHLTIEKDWDFIWSRFVLCQTAIFQLYESLTLLKDTPEQDVYELVITNGLKFKVAVNFIQKQKLSNNIMMLAFDNRTNEDVVSLSNAFSNTQQPIMHVYFEDEHKNTNQTNLVRNYSTGVFGGVLDAINQSKLKRFDHPSDIMFVHLDKREPRRLKIYQRFFKDAFPKFDKMFVDQTAADYDVAWFWKSSVEKSIL